MKKFCLIVAALFIGACSETSEEVNTQLASEYSGFPSLPTSLSQTADLNGAMTWWFWEGDGGCFGTITDGRQNIELHAEADLCEPINYEEGQEAIIRVTFDPNKQYAPNNEKMYAITKFIQ